MLSYIKYIYFCLFLSFSKNLTTKKLKIKCVAHFIFLLSRSITTGLCVGLMGTITAV